MRRTIEKLAHERREKEQQFAKKIQELKEQAQNLDCKTLAAYLAGVFELQNALIDARDKE